MVDCFHQGVHSVVFMAGKTRIMSLRAPFDNAPIGAHHIPTLSWLRFKCSITYTPTRNQPEQCPLHSPVERSQRTHRSTKGPLEAFSNSPDFRSEVESHPFVLHHADPDNNKNTIVHPRLASYLRSPPQSSAMPATATVRPAAVPHQPRSCLLPQHLPAQPTTDEYAPSSPRYILTADLTCDPV